MTICTTAFLISIFSLLSVNTAAFAQAGTFDVEIDPLAYAFDGYSVHGGYSAGFGRLDIGAFALAVSEDWLPGEGVSAKMRGFGVKWDAKPSYEQGWFYGVETSRIEVAYKDITTELTATALETQVGIRAGYRWLMGNLTISPWLGIGTRLDRSPIAIGTRQYPRDNVLVFPTIHIGYLLK